MADLNSRIEAAEAEVRRQSREKPVVDAAGSFEYSRVRGVDSCPGTLTGSRCWTLWSGEIRSSTLLDSSMLPELKLEDTARTFDYVVNRLATPACSVHLAPHYFFRN